MFPSLFVKSRTKIAMKRELVADFFCGVGAPMEATANLQRNFFGFEIDPVYDKK